jgi:hypothetical protein
MGASRSGSMAGQAQAVKAPPKRAAPKKTFTMQGLWRMALWGATAASALLVAVLSTRSEVGSQRVAIILSSLRVNSLLRPGQATTQIAARAFDAQAETRRLSDAVRGLAADSDKLKSRLAAVEHNMDDITGSITRQIEAAKAATAAPAPWPAAAAPLPATPAVIASVVTPVVPPPTDLAAPLRQNPLLPAAKQGPANAAASAGRPTERIEYGVDIGSAFSIQTLRARWLSIRSAHPQLFEGLAPTVTLREVPRSNRAELRLVVGPLANAEAAAQLCASLAYFRLFCQPTMFDRRHLALQ